MPTLDLTQYKMNNNHFSNERTRNDQINKIFYQATRCRLNTSQIDVDEIVEKTKENPIINQNELIQLWGKTETFSLITDFVFIRMFFVLN